MHALACCLKCAAVLAYFCCCRLSKVDQERVFPNSVTFDSPQDQEAFVKEWAQKRTGLACDFKVGRCLRKQLVCLQQ
jgi:hypothetical protein